jgi:plasmid stabilization system protein ParE
MSYRVVIQPPAKLDIDAAFIYLAQRAPRAAERWVNGLEDAILSLRMFPRRCAIAPERREFPEEIRHLLYGRGRGTYRVLFVIRGKTVRVLHVRHGARRAMSSDDIQA